MEYKAYQICSQNEKAKAKFEICKEYHVNSMDVRNSLYVDGIGETDFKTILGNIVKPVYDSAKMCGFSEWEQ